MPANPLDLRPSILVPHELGSRFPDEVAYVRAAPGPCCSGTWPGLAGSRRIATAARRASADREQCGWACAAAGAAGAQVPHLRRAVRGASFPEVRAAGARGQLARYLERAGVARVSPGESGAQR